MNDLISRQAVFDIIDDLRDRMTVEGYCAMIERVKALPSAQPEIVHCKDCKYQEKFFHEDKRRKEGGYYIFGCELADGYSHVCLDDDYCSRAERRLNNARSDRSKGGD